jgi:hypothetical protein
VREEAWSTLSVKQLHRAALDHQPLGGASRRISRHLVARSIAWLDNPTATPKTVLGEVGTVKVPAS